VPASESLYAKRGYGDSSRTKLFEQIDDFRGEGTWMRLR
jgi:hypothetical protein